MVSKTARQLHKYTQGTLTLLLVPCILADLTRQYKTMQTQMEGKIDFLESQVKKLQAELGKLEHIDN